MALKHFVLHGKNIAYSDTGAGAETVILVHCSGASHRIFKNLIASLSSHYRVLAPDLAGYGSSENWPANEAFHYSFDVKIISRLVALSKSPVHLVGYSYGGFLALELALQSQELQSMVLLEPAALQLLRDGEHAQLQHEVETMGERVLKSAKAGRTTRAASSYVNYWGGPFNWLLTPGRIKHSLCRTVHKTAMEFTSGYSAPASVERYQRIQCPVLVLSGSRTRTTAKTVADIVQRAINGAQRATINGARHLTLLRGNQVEQLLQQWLAQHQQQPALQSVQGQ